MPVTETDPSGRFVRYDEHLGTGAYKTVWKGFDQEEGREIAWNTVKIEHLSETDRDRLANEVSILKTLSQPNIIAFLDSWQNKEMKEFCFVTELMTSGTLRQYILKRDPSLRIIKKWAKQILLGLDYLHSYQPPIIHRDIKCDNIFINGNVGDVKIGDLGLSTMVSGSAALSVLGTPEYMAPELYDEHYTSKVDIYAFGMCFLEMVTKEYPYSECKNPAQIYKKVTSGAPPQALARVLDPKVREFIESCIGPESQRQTAAELLHSTFFEEHTNESDPVPVKTPDSPLDSPGPTVDPTPVKSEITRVHSSSLLDPSLEDLDPLNDAHVTLESRSDDVIQMTLRINVQGSEKKVKFPFHLKKDTPEAVANEMVNDLSLPSYMFSIIEKEIETRLGNSKFASQESIEVIPKVSSSVDASLADLIYGNGSEPNGTVGMDSKASVASLATLHSNGSVGERDSSGPRALSPQDVDHFLGNNDIMTTSTHSLVTSEPIEEDNLFSFSPKSNPVAQTPDLDAVLGWTTESTTTTTKPDPITMPIAVADTPIEPQVLEVGTSSKTHSFKPIQSPETPSSDGQDECTLQDLLDRHAKERRELDERYQTAKTMMETKHKEEIDRISIPTSSKHPPPPITNPSHTSILEEFENVDTPQSTISSSTLYSEQRTTSHPDLFKFEQQLLDSLTISSDSSSTATLQKQEALLPKSE